jgi:hypothetical protein
MLLLKKVEVHLNILGDGPLALKFGFYYFKGIYCRWIDHIYRYIKLSDCKSDVIIGRADLKEVSKAGRRQSNARSLQKCFCKVCPR